MVRARWVPRGTPTVWDAWFRSWGDRSGDRYGAARDRVRVRPRPCDRSHLEANVRKLTRIRYHAARCPCSPARLAQRCACHLLSVRPGGRSIGRVACRLQCATGCLPRANGRSWVPSCTRNRSHRAPGALLCAIAALPSGLPCTRCAAWRTFAPCVRPVLPNVPHRVLEGARFGDDRG